MKLDFNEKCNDAFKYHLKKAKIYGEYGCGASTIYAISNFNGHIISVETDKKWADKVQSNIPNEEKERININWIDVGPVLSWGYPVNMDKKNNFINYQKKIWTEQSPDFVLIDGRFRVACFIQSILNCNIGSSIIIDDYYNRKYYHCVEEVVELKEIYGDRMALFVKDKEIDEEKAMNIYEEYKFILS